MDVFDLAAKISLDTSEYEQGMDKSSGLMSKFSDGVGKMKDGISNFGSVFKGTLAADVVEKGFSAVVDGAKAAGQGLFNLVKDSSNAYGEYQQMVGGVEKLYGKSAKTLVSYAQNAYMTSGMSANEYMDTATQFSSSLINSLKGNVKEAAAQTDVAMRAISDNVNVFGSNMDDVTNAYKGFARQNYTMLDNLKLGYAGSKTGMEQLIKDANAWGKANGKASNLSINSFSDVITAIEQIQEKQKIAGTTAKEAMSTLQGTANMTQMAWENVKTAIGGGGDLDQAIDNLVTAIVGKGDGTGLIAQWTPTIEKAMNGIGELIGQAAPIISQYLPELIQNTVPNLLSALGSMVSAIAQALPSIFDALKTSLSTALTGVLSPDSLISNVSNVVSQLITAISGVLPQLIQVLGNVVVGLIQGITNAAPQLIDAIVQAIQAIIAVLPQILQAIVDALPVILPALVQGITQLIQSLAQALPQLIQTLVQALPTVIQPVMDAIVKAAPQCFHATLQLITALVQYLPQAIQIIVQYMPQLIQTIITAVIQTLPEIISGLIQLVSAIVQAMPQIISTLIEAVPQIVKSVGDAFQDPQNVEAMKKAGKELVKGIGKGFEAMGDWIKDKAKKLGDKIIKGIKDFFGIHSPSRKMAKEVGEPVVKGLWQGMSDKVSWIVNKVKEFAGKLPKAIRDKVKDIGKEGQTFVKNLWNGISDKVSWAVGKVKDFAGKFPDAVKKGWDKVKSAGGNFVEGLWNGINDKVGWVVEKVKGFGGQVLGALKKFFKIESPSKVMRDEVGVYLAQGVAKGIEKDESKAVKAAERMARRIVKSSKDIVLKSTNSSDNLANAVYKSVDKTEKKTVKKTETKKLKNGKTKTTTKNKSITVRRSQEDIAADTISAGKKKVKELEDANKMSLQQEASFWVSLAGKVKSGSKVAYGQAMKLANKAVESQQANRLEKAKNSLQSYQNLHDTSAKYEASYWKKYLKSFTKGSKQDLEVHKLYNDARKKIQDERLQKYQDYVSNYSALHDGEEMSEKASMDFWKTVRDNFKKGSSQWIEAQNNFLSARKSFNEGFASLQSELTKSVQDAQKTYDDALKQIDDNINSKRDSIISGLGDIFAQFDSGDPADKDAMSKALDSQLAAEDEWGKKLAELGDKVGTDSDLYKMMSEKGAQDGLAYLRAFVDDMSDEELASYNKRYNERIEKARKEAEKEMKPETDKAQQKALEDYVSSMSDAYQTAILGMKDLGLASKEVAGNIKGGTTTLVKDFATKMTSLGMTTSDTQKTIQSIIQDKAPDIANAARKSGKDMLSSFISGIENQKGALESTLKDVSKTVASYIGFSEPDKGPLSNFHTFAPDMMELFSSGIIENKDKIKDAFDESLGFGMPDNYGTFTVKPDKDSLMGENGINQLLSLLQQYLPQLGNQQIVLDDGTLVGKTVNRMNEELAYINNRRAGAFA